MKCKTGLKKLLAAGVIAGVLLSINTYPAFAAQKLYSQVTTETVTKGVTYEKNHRLTADGWQDIYVLKVNLDDSNIKIAPVESSTEYGLKETVLKMITDSGAVAGVNADFFGMTGKYSASFGPVIKDGNLVSAGTDRNIGKNEYATFFLDNEGNPFINFFNLKADFYANTNSHLELASINKITEMKYPIYFDANASADTGDLDARFSGLVKLVVENDVITKISAKGETVSVPENGYLIIMNGDYYDGVSQYFTVGQNTDLKIQASLDLNKIDTAISGVGKILENGQLSANPGLVINGRQPRTALGISQDKNTLILMVVDGRGTSIGATHQEMADLMLEYGAYDAMHLDGGGSTTMVANTTEDMAPVVKNKVSDGAERKVINAVGVFNNAPVTELSQIVLKPSKERIFKGNSVSFQVIGYDEYYHKLDVPVGDVTFETSDPEGVFNGSVFTPNTEGKAIVTATYNGLSAVATVDTMALATLKANVDSLSMDVGQTAQLSFTGVSTEGYEGAISNVVVSSDLGTYENGVFTATQTGAGYIQCSLGAANYYIKLSVDTQPKDITSFEDNQALTFTSYPKTIPGAAYVTTYTAATGSKSLALEYTFAQSDTTQAAYMQFNTPFAIGGSPTVLKMKVYGNNSGQWLRGKLLDADGKEIIIDFTKNINWTGWQEVSASIPAGTKYPVKLDTIYVAALSNTDTDKKALYFDDLSGTFPLESDVTIPASTSVPDSKRADLSQKEAGAYYINIAGTVMSDNQNIKASPSYTDARVNVHNQLQTDAGLMVYGGKSDISAQSSVDTLKWWSQYKYYDKNGVSVVQMTAANGSLRTTSAAQWLYFQNDIANSANKNVIILLDKSPSNWSDAQEAILFRSALSELKESGKEIFVVSSSGYSYWNTVKEGIRYINLPDLWNPNGSVNTNFKILTFKVSGDSMVYDVKNAF